VAESDLSVGNILTALHRAPFWLLAGLAIAGYVILFASPGFAGIDVTGFRAKWGAWIWAGTVVSTVLALACAIDAACRRLPQWWREWTYRPLRIEPFLPACRWSLTKQQDGSLFSQVMLPFDVLNTEIGAVDVVRAWLIRPHVRPELVQPLLLHCDIPAQTSKRLSITFLVRRALGTKGQTLHLTIGLMGHTTRKYSIKVMVAPTP
jgi:hypothetical protein